MFDSAHTLFILGGRSSRPSAAAINFAPWLPWRSAAFLQGLGRPWANWKLNISPEAMCERDDPPVRVAMSPFPSPTQLDVATLPLKRLAKRA